jgi:hypothetical protein
MTKEEEKLIERLRALGKTTAIIEPATVKSVDTANLTCVVELADETEISDVRLKAAIDNVKDGLVQIPVVGSTVLVGSIGNKVSVRCVIMFSKVSEVLFNGGENGGLINIQTLITELNKTNEVVNAIKDSLLNWTPVPNDGGAALQTFASGQLAGKSTGVFDGMEDTKVKH